MVEQTVSDNARPLNRGDAKTLVLSALGGALEFYDFIIYVFFAVVIGKLFFPADMPDWLRQLQTYGIFAAGYLARPLGGIVMAHFGDRFGRKRMFALSVFLMAVPTLCIGLLPTYAAVGLWAPLALLLLRVLQGAAIGGEIPGAWVFVAEHAPANRTGLAVGMLTSGLTGGILLGSLVAAGVTRHYGPEQVAAFAWRIPFILGGIFGFVAVYLRRWLDETPVFEELRRRKALSQELPLKVVVSRHLGGVLRSMLVTWVLTAAIVVVILMTPALLQKLDGFTAAQTLTANSVATLMLTLGCIGAGALADRFGPGPVLGIGSVLLLLCTYAMYLGLGQNPGLLVPLYGLTGLCVAIVGVIPLVLVRNFPPAVRFSGISFSYNVAYAVFGGFTPPLVAMLGKASPLGPAHYVAAMCVIGLLMGLFGARQPASALQVSQPGAVA
ncbi:MFS transporter [Nevskia soli]|uniref:MFS transporter n=1 Tax=Nevskia soli TaxID=418856 RepID=UPI000689F924